MNASNDLLSISHCKLRMNGLIAWSLMSMSKFSCGITSKMLVFVEVLTINSEEVFSILHILLKDSELIIFFF